MKTNKFLVAALAGITLAGCSSDDELQYPDFTGPVEVQFAGELTSDPILQTAWTRSGEEGSDGQDGAAGQDGADEPESGGGSNSGSESNNDNWDDSYSSIGITPTSITGKTSSGNTIGKYFNVKYTTTSTGTTATFKAESDTIFFQSPKETVTFAAYSPYCEDLASDGDNKGIISLSTDNAHNVTDYIWAQAEGATYTDNKVNFAFTHIQSKLKINVKLDESVSLPKEVTTTTTEPTVTIASVKIEGLVESGTFNTATGESTTASGADATEILYNYDANTGVSVAEGYEYIIIPQTIAAKGFILTVTTSNGDIYKKTFDSKITFAPGYAYTYNITAKKYNLEVEATISKWSEEDEDDEDAMMTKAPIIGDFDEPEKAELYDLVFSDGSFKHVVETVGGDVPSSITLTDKQKSEVRGIVYYKGDVTEDDPILKRDYKDCNHGLIVALNNNEGITEVPYWQKTLQDICASFQNASESDYSESKGYKKIQIYTLYCMDGAKDYRYWNPQNDDQTILDAKLGYNNTVVLRAYNESKKDATDYQVIPVIAVDDYNKTYAAPSGCSDWYLPSAKEAGLLYDAVTKMMIPETKPNTIETSNVMEKLISVFSLLKEAGVSVKDLSATSKYLIGLECYANGLKYCYVKNHANVDIRINNGTSYTDMEVRPICAF